MNHSKSITLVSAPRCFADILAERVRQDMKWGEQSHQSMEWLAILTEEVGELAQAVNEQRWRARPDTLHELRLELVQVAAVAAAWLECLDRAEQGGEGT